MRRMLLPLTLLFPGLVSLAVCGSARGEGIARGFGQLVPPGGGLVENDWSDKCFAARDLLAWWSSNWGPAPWWPVVAVETAK
jgi:hypothetical protein